MCIKDKKEILKAQKELKQRCEIGHGWCPNTKYKTPCEICGGVEDLLTNICYDCDKCKMWGKTPEEEEELRRVM